MRGLVEQYLNQERVFNFEGFGGVNKFNKLVKALGYERDFNQDSLYAFLADNSGAIDAMVEWIAKQRFASWAASMEQHIQDEG